VQGGNALLNYDKDQILAGSVIGNNGSDPLTQNIKHDKTYILCENDKQEGQLPTPFHFGPDNSKIKCLDYKIRYCCKTNNMLRPVNIKDFGSQLQIDFPVGAIGQSTFNLNTEGIPHEENDAFTLAITNPRRAAKRIAFDLKNKIKVDEHTTNFTITGRLFEAIVAEKVAEFGGSCIFSTEPSRFTKMMLTVKSQSHTIAYIEANIRVDTGMFEFVETEIYSCEKKSNHCPLEWRTRTKFTKEIKPLEQTNDDGVVTTHERPCYLINTTFYTFSSELVKYVYIEQFGTWTIQTMYKNQPVIKIATEIEVNPISDDKLSFEKRFFKLQTEITIEFVIESPPLDEIFAECEWKDWISLNYPSKHKNLRNVEYEMRYYFTERNRRPKLLAYNEHVCGPEPHNVLMVDAVTKEHCVPWREHEIQGIAMTHLSIHYKLTPYFGYACSDVNMYPYGEKRGCQDMKVRYCCAKKRYGGWAHWSEWGSCTVTCGGGKQIRTRTERKCGGDYCVKDPSYDKRLKTETRDCNVEGCPVEFSWTSWTRWLCSASCGEGKKKRYRECIPPQNGGAECPDKNDPANFELYNEVTECTEQDCEKYEPTAWIEWSSCSVTCGQGFKKRTRKCKSQKTLQIVDSIFCNDLQDSSLFGEQTFTCNSNSLCPVDGTWVPWAEWSKCNQNCVNEGEGSSRTHRWRISSCQGRVGNGKDCTYEEGINIEYIDGNKKQLDYEYCRQTLKPCPEDCIFSEWSLWSTCSSTCIERQVSHLTEEEVNNYLEDPEELSTMSIVLEPYSNEKLPIRSRTRIVIKEEKHGGECRAYNINCMNSTTGASIKVDIEEEKCVAWSGHAKIGVDLRKYPDAVYPVPNEENNVIPICPIPCEWETWHIIEKCDRNQEELHEDPTKRCYTPETLQILQDATKDHKTDGFWDNYRKLEAAFKSVIIDLYTNKDASENLPAGLTGCLRRRRRPPSCRQTNLRQIRAAFKDDVQNIKYYMKTVKERYAVLPNLNGLFGGAACKMLNGTELTHETVPAGDNTRVQDFVEEITLYECSLCLIIPPVPHPHDPVNNTVTTTTPPPVTPPVCTIDLSGLSSWGAWSECRTADCGTGKIANRTRVCEKRTECTGEPVCYHDLKTVEDKPCQDCPPETKFWTPWGPWTVTPEYCGTGYVIHTRERHCKRGKDLTRGCPPEPLKMTHTDSRRWQLRPCK